MFLRICKDALDMTIGLFIFILLLSIPFLFIVVAAWLYYINIILGIIFTPILIYLIILISGVIAHLDDINEKLEQRRQGGD